MSAAKFISFVWIFYATQIHGFPHDKSPFKTVITTDGFVRGKLLTTHKHTDFYAFQDIPYAQPPIGTLRLKEALPPIRWKGVLNTTDNSKICYQFNQNRDDPRESEDCLVLNVYSTAHHEKLLPVIVWMHGGGFTISSGAIDTFGPHYFIDKKIVVVTVNYRLGPLGFLSTEDGVVPENLGLKDQHLALKWVQKNIARFGGDPLKVTLGGQEGGAALVGYHILNKKSKGLFRAAIMQSGSPLGCWTLHTKARNVAQYLANAISHTDQTNLTSQEILNIFKTADVEQIKKEFIKLQIERHNRQDMTTCHQMDSYPVAVVKEDNKNKNAFVTGMNHEKLKNGDTTQVPILIGFNSEEMLVWNITKLLLQTSLMDLDDSIIVPANLNMRNENRREAGHELKSLYTNSSFALSQSSSLSFLADCAFTTPVARHAILQSQYTDVYFYQFSYVGTLGRYEYYDFEGGLRVGNREELGYFWPNTTSINLDQFPKEDILTHERVVELWSQFIKHLNPTAHTSSLLGNLKWPKVAEKDFLYLDIDSELSIKSGPKKYTSYNRIYSKYTTEKLDTY